MNISTVVGLKNNLNYTQYFYNSFREIYPNEQICFVSYASTDGTDEWLKELSSSDINVKCYTDAKPASLAATYNKGVELSDNKYVVFLHNDMIINSGFLENIEKHLLDNNAICYSVVEPPVFTNLYAGKIIHDCGDSLESFDKNKFDQFCIEHINNNSGKTETGATFYMCLEKKTFSHIGGFDTFFDPMFAEDEDIIRRLQLFGINFLISSDALCYHFVSKTSRFSSEFQKLSSDIEYRSNRNFIRKWGSTLKSPVYRKAFFVTNCTNELIELLEPWCNDLYIKTNNINIYDQYIKNEQPHTKIDLSEKLHTFMDTEYLPKYNISISFDAKDINESTFGALAHIPNVIKNNNKIGVFKLGIFTIFITRLIEEQNNLIICNNV